MLRHDLRTIEVINHGTRFLFLFKRALTCYLSCPCVDRYASLGQQFDDACRLNVHGSDVVCNVACWLERVSNAYAQSLLYPASSVCK
jgi:hypothetical protein